MGGNNTAAPPRETPPPAHFYDRPRCAIPTNVAIYNHILKQLILFPLAVGDIISLGASKFVTDVRDNPVDIKATCEMLFPHCEFVAHLRPVGICTCSKSQFPFAMAQLRLQCGDGFRPLFDKNGTAWPFAPIRLIIRRVGDI